MNEDKRYMVLKEQMRQRVKRIVNSNHERERAGSGEKETGG